MNPLQTRMLTRQQIGDFVGSPRGVRAFESVQADIAAQYDALTSASFLTLTNEPSLGAERRLVLTSGELVGTDGGANSDYTLGLSNTAVVAGSYGDASHLVRVTVDVKGRLTGIAAYALNSDNATEGVTNLFFTTSRARSAISAGAGISYDSSTGVVTATGDLASRAVTGSVTVLAADRFLLANASGGVVTINLPAAASSTGRVLYVKKTDASANIVTIDGNAAETIDGAATKNLTAQYDSVTVQCDGSTWWIL